MVQVYRLDTRHHTGLRSWRVSLKLVPSHQASASSWRAAKHTRRPSSQVGGAGGRTVQPVSAIQEPSGQQEQQQQQHDSWLQTCKQVAAFQQKHGRLPLANAGAQGPLLTGERPLGVWCTVQQRRAAGSKGPPLSAEERAVLQAIPGWRWWVPRRVMVPWEQRRQEVEAFYQQHGRLPRRDAALSRPYLPGEKELGMWTYKQRNHYRGHQQPPLSAARIAALEGTPGWSWGEYTNTPWGVRCQQLQDFVRQHGRLPRTGAGSSSPLLPDEKQLGHWRDKQRQNYKRQKLSTEQIAALEATPGWYWGVCKIAWELRLEEVQAFVRQHGRIPHQRGSIFCEKELGLWCDVQKRRWKGSTHQPPLTAEQLAALAAVPGWFFDEGERWEHQRQQLEAFVQQHGRLPRKKGSGKKPLVVGERELGNWRAAQWKRHRGTGGLSSLTAKQLAALEAIPLWCSSEAR